MSSRYRIKILLCGPDEVKTSLIRKIIKPRFLTDYELSVAVDILTKDIELSNSQIATLSIWDISSQERFSFIRSTFYEGAAGAIFVFDLSRAATWDDIKNWRAEIKQFAGDIPFALIGNNLDLLQDVGEVIDRDECREYAESQGSIYAEASAKNITAVEDAIIKLVEIIITGDRSSSYIYSTKYPKRVSKKKERERRKELQIKKIEEDRRKKEEDLLMKIKKVLQVSSRVKLSMLRNILDLDEKTFDNRILEWAYILNFRIDGDFIVIENADIDGFIEILDKQFELWKKKDKSDKN